MMIVLVRRIPKSTATGPTSVAPYRGANSRPR